MIHPLEFRLRKLFGSDEQNAKLGNRAAKSLYLFIRDKKSEIYPELKSFFLINHESKDSEIANIINNVSDDALGSLRNFGPQCLRLVRSICENLQGEPVPAPFAWDTPASRAFLRALMEEQEALAAWHVKPWRLFGENTTPKQMQAEKKQQEALESAWDAARAKTAAALEALADEMRQEVERRA